MPVESARSLAAWTIAMLVLAVALVWALYLARQALLLIYVSGILAVGFSPVVRMIERQRVVPVGSRRLPRWLAILVVYLAIVAVVAGIGSVVLPPAIAQSREFATQLPDLLQQAQGFLARRGLLPTPVSMNQIVQQAPAPTDIVGAVIIGFWGVVGGLFGLVTILIMTFYFLVEADGLFATFVRLFPARRRAQVRELSGKITQKVSGWLTGQLILAAIIGSTTAVVLGVIGLPYFYVLAVIAGVGEMIPYVGPIVSALPGIAVAASSSWKLALGVAVFYLAQQQLEGNILVPKLMEQQVGLSAAWVIVALLIGHSLLGIPGAILAVPTAAIVQVLFQELVATDR